MLKGDQYVPFDPTAGETRAECLFKNQEATGRQNEYFEPLREEGKSQFTIKFLWKLPASSIHELPKPVIQTTTITSNGQLPLKKQMPKQLFIIKLLALELIP